MAGDQHAMAPLSSMPHNFKGPETTLVSGTPSRGRGYSLEQYLASTDCFISVRMRELGMGEALLPVLQMWVPKNPRNGQISVQCVLAWIELLVLYEDHGFLSCN